MQNLKTRRTMALVLLLILAGAALFLLLGKGASSFLPGSNKPFVGNQAPDFTVMDLQNRSVTLSQLRGKPVLLNFWASWCPPCKEETPDLVKIANQYKGQIQFVGVNLTAQDNVSDLKAFVKQYGIDYQVLLDSDDKVRTLYQVEGIPTTLLIDAKGKIIDRPKPHPLTSDELLNMIHEVVK